MKAGSLSVDRASIAVHPSAVRDTAAGDDAGRSGRAAARAHTPLRDPDVAAFPLDDELVLYAPHDHQAYVLNATAARIWEQCDGSRTIGRLARDMAASYSVSYEQAFSDVRELLEGLRSARLIADR